MINPLYNCVTTIDGDGNGAYRITKFVDGNVESSYITTRKTCDCPAGVRPICRHRQMLPAFLNHNIVNQPWFWDFDLQIVVDFQGAPPPAAPEIQPNPQPHSVVASTVDFDSASGGSNPPAVAKSSWRRI